MNNVRIAIRDSTDSHNVAFFDNKAGIKYKSANLLRFLAGSASILTIKYNSKDIDSIRSGCKLAFRYKNRDYWLNVMSFEKKGFEVELTAYSLGLELNNETRGEHKPANAMSIAEYVAYYDPEHALTIGINEVSDKRIKLEWTGTDTILARLFSVANSFGAELDFNVELNDDYSLKRQVLNIYKKGNLGTNKVSQPVRVGKELKVINYSDNIKELRTAVRATGKDGLTIDGLNKKIYDNNKELLYYSSGMTVYAPQSCDRFPSVGKGSNDNWIVKDLGETQYETKEALWGYMYGEIQKISVPEITYEVEGAIDAGIGDTQTLIDDIHFEPALYVQARVSELEDDILTGKVTKSTFINFERKYSQIADILLKQVEALAEDAAPYIVRLSTDNGYNFKNGQGSSTITAKLEKYSKIVNADWKWLINNSVVSETSSVTINASQVTGTLNVVAVARVDGNEVAREYITFTNSDDGVGIKSIKRYYTTNDQAEGVTAGGQNWTTKPTTVTADKNYMWSYDVITYTNDTSLVTEPAVIGARGDDGLDADTTGITEALDKAKQELTALSANIEKVRDDSLAAVEEAKQQLAAVANDLSKAKTDLQNAVSEVDTKATNLQSDLTKAKQDLTSQASQLQAQASAQSELTKRVSSVEETASGTKTTVSELSKTVDSNTKNITSVTARTKVVEDDLLNTKTTMSQVQTTADNTSKKTATLETGLSGLTAKFENLSVGTTNHFLDSAFETTIQKIGIFQNGNVYTPSIDTTEKYDGYNTLKIVCKDSTGVDNPKITYPALAKLKTVQQGKLPDVITISFWGKTDTEGMSLYTRLGYTGYEGSQNVTLATDWKRYIVHVKTSSAATNEWLFKFSKAGTVWIAKPQFEFSAIASDYHLAEEDTSSKVAEYKQTAEQNYASLQSNLQTLDGTVKQNKSEFDQTAQGFSTRIESLETYKDGETTRANQYFESAKTETARQLTAERTAIAKDYVAKSTYTSDVTGIRNDLTATTTTANTTKTNLANYQASNDKAVANLQSNLQTANGNISSLQTKVEAVPGQITSAVSSVEGKIPTSLDSLNLMTGTRDWSTKTNKWHMGANWSTESDEYQGLKVHSTQKGYNGSHQNIFVKNGDIVTFSFFAKATNTLSKIKVSSRWPDSSVYQAPLAGVKESDEQITITSEWKRYSKTVHIISDGSLQFRTEYDGSTIPDGNTFYIAGLKLAKSVLDTGYSENPTDAASDLSAVSSELKQTKDGMTLLATKTELNSAKTELQSGITAATNKANTAQSTANSNAQTISTHTTQISALNTGLSAKVSQTDFNTLSGRVTTAENNITAKANELSSKISSVEGQIPTTAGGRNYALKTGDSKSSTGGKLYDLSSAFDDLADNATLIIEFDWSVTAPTSTSKFRINRVITYSDGTANQWDDTILVNDSYGDINSATKSGHYSGTFKKIKYNSTAVSSRYLNLNQTTPSGTVTISNLSVRIGSLRSDWQPSPEDYDSKLASAQSEIKQTTDAISASVSSVETKADTAQSTANTAVSKADAAQAGINTLDSTTVKSASLTINTDGIVMKAGKSTTDIANAIGSYFAVNQNAINLFSDKINVKGSMIVDGAITSNKIAAGTITADMFKGNQITSLNGATTLNLYTGEIIFNNQYATINQIKGSYKSQISLSSVDYKAVNESAWSSVNTLAFNSTNLTSATRRAGSTVDMFSKFSLMTLYGEKIAFTGETSGIPNSQNAIIVNTNSDDVNFTNSQTNSSEGAWNYSMIMDFGADAAISAPDIKLAGHFKSLTGILDDLCKKVGVMWI
ncbi:Chromosome partition protein Smc [Streptococcus infantarius subsp. infantarius]|nr:Chromosome partition protein Smc [Streptococcus infantarius subsp. infantarius]